MSNTNTTNPKLTDPKIGDLFFEYGSNWKVTDYATVEEMTKDPNELEGYAKRGIVGFIETSKPRGKKKWAAFLYADGTTGIK